MLRHADNRRHPLRPARALELGARNGTRLEAVPDPIIDDVLALLAGILT